MAFNYAILAAGRAFGSSQLACDQGTLLQLLQEMKGITPRLTLKTLGGLIGRARHGLEERSEAHPSELMLCVGPDGRKPGLYRRDGSQESLKRLQRLAILNEDLHHPGSKPVLGLMPDNLAAAWAVWKTDPPRSAPWYRQRGQRAASFEGPSSNEGGRLWDAKACERMATTKGLAANLPYGLGDSQAPE